MPLPMSLWSGQDAQALERAAQALAAGELVAFPTETVYGLGARADDDRAVTRIFDAKGRPPDHPLIVHVADAAAAAAFAQPVSETAQRLMQAFWPGPVSLVLPRRADVAGAAAGGLPTVALRCPAHPVAQALLRRLLALGVPGLAAPSANRFGRVSPTRAEHVVQEFGAGLPVLDGGPCEAGIESAIVDCSGPRATLLRPGSLPRQQIEAALQQALADPTRASPRVSGSLESHYAPQACVQLVEPEWLASIVGEAQQRLGDGRVGVWARQRPAQLPAACFIAMPDNAGDAARLLFHTLREFDAAGMQLICVENPQQHPDWEGVRDRLQRAAAPR